MKDYFKILGVAESATPEEIKAKYKKLAMVHHPDRGGEQAKFQEIQEAYATLSDPEKRAQWQHGLHQQNHQQHHGHPFGNHPGFEFNFGQGMDLNDILRGFSNGDPFGHFNRQPAKNRDLRVALEVDLESTLSAQTKHINIQTGQGPMNTVSVDIPRGVMPGMQMRCPGHGDKTHANLPPGDLYVEFRFQPHPVFQVMGSDLIKLTEIDCIDAMLGVQYTLKGIDGKQFEIIIPAATQHGTRMRVPGQGLWVLNQEIRGDLYLDIVLKVSRSITTEQLQKLQQLVK